MAMNLMEITRLLHELDPEKTIYARRPWFTNSDAVIATETEGTLVPVELAEKGYEYFVEVHIAQEFMPDLSHIKPSFTLEQWCERLIQYAENDA